MDRLTHTRMHMSHTSPDVQRSLVRITTDLEI